MFHMFEYDMVHQCIQLDPLMVKWVFLQCILSRMRTFAFSLAVLHQNATCIMTKLSIWRCPKIGLPPKSSIFMAHCPWLTGPSGPIPPFQKTSICFIFESKGSQSIWEANKKLPHSDGPQKEVGWWMPSIGFEWGIYMVILIWWQLHG